MKHSGYQDLNIVNTFAKTGVRKLKLMVIDLVVTLADIVMYTQCENEVKVIPVQIAFTSLTFHLFKKISVKFITFL